MKSNAQALRLAASWTAGAIGTNSSMACAERPRVKGTRVLRLAATDDARVADILFAAGAEDTRGATLV
jgi:hypothetical protein